METADEMPGERRGRPSKYPWDKWTNGQIWKVKYGEDFKCVPESFRNMLHGYARRKFGLRVETSLEESVVTFRFWKEYQDG